MRETVVEKWLNNKESFVLKSSDFSTKEKGGNIMWTLSVDRESCNQCGICQVMSSLAKKKTIQPTQSRIQVDRRSGTDFQSLIYCHHCAEPICVDACLMGGAKIDFESGRVDRNTEKCFACGACRVMCPVGASVYDSDEDAYVTCDLCDGDPVCVKVCPQNAIKYMDVADVSVEIRNRAGARFFQGRQEGW